MMKTPKPGLLNSIKRQFKYIKADSLDRKGIKYLQKGQYQKAVSIFHSAGKLLQEIGDRSGVGKELGNLAMTYRMLDATQNNVEYLNKGIEYGKRRWFIYLASSSFISRSKIVCV